MSTIPLGFYNTPSGQPPLNWQDQLDALNSDLSGDASQSGATDAYNQLAMLGAPLPTSPMYSTGNIGANGQLTTAALPIPAAPQPTTPQSSAPPGPTGYVEMTPGNWVYTGGTGASVPYSSTLNGIEAARAAGTYTPPAFNSPQQIADGLAGGGGSTGPIGPTFGTNPTGGISPANYNSAISAMMGGAPNITATQPGGSLSTAPAATSTFTRPLPSAGGQPAMTSPGAGPTVPTTAQQITNTPPAWQNPTLGGPGTTGVAPATGTGQPAAQTGGLTPTDQTGGLTYTSQPGNFPTGTPMVPNSYDPQFLANYGAATNGALNAIGNAYNSAPWGYMTAAQMNQGAVPQVQAQTPQSFQALQFLLSGQGFDPATIARMNAQASDSISQSAAGTMSAARQAAERAGLLNSGLGVGLQANVANQAGIQNTQALNQIQIANAQQGIQNLQTGAGMNLNLQENAAQQANQVALQNTANMFSSMTQNLANQQASNAANFAGQQQRALGQAQGQANYASGAGQNLQQGMTNQYYGANVNNANLANNQWQTAGGWLNNLSNYGNPYGSVGANASNAGNTNANTSIGNTLLGYGASQGVGG